jgi:hypothetical protein
MAISPTERSWCVLEFARCNSFVAVQRAFRRQYGRCGPPDTSIRISLQTMYLSSGRESRGEAKCYRRDGWQSAWNFHSQPQEICAESQSSVEDTGAHSEKNSTETTAVVPIQTATGTKFSDSLYTPCIITRVVKQFHLSDLKFPSIKIKCFEWIFNNYWTCSFITHIHFRRSVISDNPLGRLAHDDL